MIKDEFGNKVKHDDTIKTERGVVLSIVEDDGILYMINSGNNQRSPLSSLNIDFWIQEKED